MKFLSLLITGLFICASQCSAQGISPVFDEFNFESGLSSNEIHCIVQDDDGFLWIGTSGGLNRYDGNSFIQYFKSRDSNSIADNRVNDLCVLPHHILAIATAGGLNFLDTHTGLFKTFHIQDSTQLFLFRNYFTKLCLDSNKNLWAGTQTDLLVFNPELKVIRSFPGSYSVADINRKIIQWVGNMYLLPDGNLLVSQNNELVMYDPNNFKSNKLSRQSQPPLISFLKNQFSSFLYDSRQRFWGIEAGNDSIFSYNISTNKIGAYPLFKNAHLYFKWFSSLFSFDENTFFLHIADTGFFRITANDAGFSVKHIDNLPPSNDVTTFFHDRQGNLWIGTAVGLYEWSSFKNQFHSVNLTNGVSGNLTAEAGSFLRNGDELWIGSYGNGVYDYNLKNKTIRHVVFKLPNANLLSEVWNIRRYKEDTLWIGTQEGLVWFVPSKNKYGRLSFAHPAILDSFPITTQFKDSKGCIWMGVGIGHGVVCFNVEKKSFTVYDNHSKPAFPLRHPTAIAEDENGDLWMGTQRGGGLAHWNRATGNFSLIPANTNSAFSDDRINTLFADPHQHIWMGTTYAGVISYDIKNKIFKNFGKEKGLSNEKVFNINGTQYPYLWITTNIGLNRLNALNGKIESFFKKDGLPTDAVIGGIYYDSLSDLMYVGYDNGMIQFDAKSYFANNNLPGVFINALIVNDKPLHADLNKSISFNYKENNLTVNFTAADLVNGSDLKFRYRLSNEKSWNDAGKNRSIHFSNLSPGNYALLIEVANKAGAWNEKGTSLNFSIMPPFWKTWWFYTVVAAVFIAIVYSMYRFRIRQLQRVQEMRNRIAQDLHDDIGGTMTAMNLTNELAMQHLHEPVIAKKLMINISDDLKNVGETLDDIVWTVNPKNDSMQEVMARMRRYASRTWEAAGIDFNFLFDENAENIRLNMEQRHDLYLIFKEAVNNVAKHAQCTHASSSMSLSDHSLLIEIKDDGKGFDAQASSNRNGLKNIQGRIQKWKGNFEIDSANGRGTKIRLRLPITQKGD